jgi:hypothetical protein
VDLDVRKLPYWGAAIVHEDLDGDGAGVAGLTGDCEMS